RNGRRPAALRTLIVGSDTLHSQAARDATTLLWPGVTLVNGYGLSECTIESLVHDCAGPTMSRSGLCPLGTPLPGTVVRIVDEHGRQLPPGAIGELLIGGPQVGAGYLDADGRLDSSRVTVDDGVRWFHTGDLGRLGELGVIEFFGRRDRQVKVRGQRVELGE